MHLPNSILWYMPWSGFSGICSEIRPDQEFPGHLQINRMDFISYPAQQLSGKASSKSDWPRNQWRTQDFISGGKEDSSLLRHCSGCAFTIGTLTFRGSLNPLFPHPCVCHRPLPAIACRYDSKVIVRLFPHDKRSDEYVQIRFQDRKSLYLCLQPQYVKVQSYPAVLVPPMYYHPICLTHALIPCLLSMSH